VERAVTFNSVTYIVFLAVVVAAYWRLRHRHQNVVLLVASYVFYGAWNWRFLSLMLISTVLDYSVGRAMPGSRHKGRLLLVSMVGNLGILATFKYFGFFVDSAYEFLDAIGIGATRPTLDVLLPVGISFYTFQTMSYTIDIYRGTLQPTRKILDFAVFVAFFPQLVAGPIERAANLLPQVQRPRLRPDRATVESGLFLIVLGLFKKVVIADTVARAVDPVFADAGNASALTLLLGVYGFAVQIYMDFSGYSDIARGSARLLGFELMVNFRQPYLSRDVTEFWRLWHISLSSWLRDYLYIPLCGNRRGRFRTRVNLMTTMLLGGLWHGASWNFVVWGGLHGLYLGRERSSRPKVRERVLAAATVEGAPAPAPRTVAVEHDVPTVRSVPGIVLTFHLVCLSWILFRADTFGDALDFVLGIVTLRGGVPQPTLWAAVLPGIVVMVVLDVLQRRAGDDNLLLSTRPLARGLLYGAWIGAILVFSGETSPPFIYFQF
jgi:alginate O-acetyltransferase complex protein AlgI